MQSMAWDELHINECATMLAKTYGYDIRID